MISAASAWDVLATELSSAATGYGSVVSELTSGGWLGPTSLSMATAVAPYVAWLHSTAAQAEQTAAQAKEAAAAYEFAFAMTVPPPVIAANRTLLMTLVATNFFGQNAPAIAATEAHYAEMWIQDATAMYGYAGSSAAASQLTPFTSPRPTTDPAGLATQSGTVANAVSNAAAPQPTLSQLVSAMPTALQQLAAPTAAPDPISASTVLTTGLSATKFINTALSFSSAGTSARGILIQQERIAAQETPAYEEEPKAPSARMAASGVSAGMGRANLVGSLSVPPGWATEGAAIRPVALALPGSDAAVTSAAATDIPPIPGSAFSQAVLGTLSRHGFDGPRPKSKPVLVRSPAAG